MPLSTFLRNALRDHVYRTATYSKPATVYISLHTGDPGGTGVNEVSGGSYARVAVNTGDANWSASNPGEAANVAVVTFPAPTAAWGITTHVGSWDAPSGGNFLEYGQLAVPKTINNGDAAPSFAIGLLKALFS